MCAVPMVKLDHADLRPRRAKAGASPPTAAMSMTQKNRTRQVPLACHIDLFLHSQSYARDRNGCATAAPPAPVANQHDNLGLHHRQGEIETSCDAGARGVASWRHVYLLDLLA